MAKVLSESFYRKMKELDAKYPRKTAQMLPALHAAQEELGWLPAEAMDEIAAYLGVHPAQVREVATFYTMYNTKPVGRYHLKICTNVACTLRGAERIVKYCENSLGIKVNETTPDGKFTLSEEECLGACGTAPAMTINDDYHENLDETKIDRILEGLE